VTVNNNAAATRAACDTAELDPTGQSGEKFTIGTFHALRLPARRVFFCEVLQ
jgi:hypothetical protein